MSRPLFKNGLLVVYSEPDTWCNPMHVVGMFADLADMAWDQRAKAKDGQRRFTERQAEALVKVLRRAADLRAQDVKGLVKMGKTIIETNIEGDNYNNGFKSDTHFIMARRNDSALDLYAIERTIRATLALVLPQPNRYHHTTGKKLRDRVECQLGYFDMWTCDELELRWRLRDARWKAGAQVRGQRAGAFEALWQGGEHAQAYEFVGAKLPQQWDDDDR